MGTLSRRRARNALIAATGLITVCLATARSPSGWSAVALTRPEIANAGPLGPLWAALADLIPLGELALRADLLAAALVGLCALASSWAAFQLFRGPGRWLAAVAAGPIVAVALLGWVHEAGAPAAVRLLPPTLIAALAIAWAVRSLVHFGFVTPLARARLFGACALAAVLEPRMGLPLIPVALFAAYGLGRSRRRERSGAHRIGPIVVALVPATITFGAIWFAGCTWPPLDATSIYLAVPTIDPLLGGHLPAAAAYAGLALVALLVMPLRWRGGLVLVLLTVGGLIVHDADGPLAPMPALLMIVSTAAAGWIWLAGSAAPRSRPQLGRILAVLATPAATLLAIGPVAAEALQHAEPVAHDRTTASLHRVYEKGLVAPGDVIVSYGTWSETILEARETQGWRPDVTWTTGDGMSASELMRLAMDVGATNRRLLSNSFSAGGSWSAAWVLDSGPLFWFVGPGLPEERDFTDLSRFLPKLEEMPRQERDAWLQMIAERARFRRALGEPAAALGAMPLSSQSHRGLNTRLQLASNARPSAGRESELPPLLHGLPDDPRALWAAEGGDLLYAHGERERATELLAEAAAAGYTPALAALARWQFRGGEDEAARRTVAALARTKEMRGDATAMVRWLLARQRTADATLLLDAMHGGTASDAPAELTARLRLLSAQALVPPPTPPDPDPDTLTRR